MRERVGDVDCIRPWVGLHHGGVRMDSGELERVLQMVAEGGLVTMIYWHNSDMAAEDWEVVKAAVR